MHKTSLKLAAATAVLGALVLGVGPVAAVNQYDSHVRCDYNVTQSSGGTWTKARLKHLTVTPPTMKAIVGNSETVRWRFWVLRSTNQSSGPWKVTYYSPWQTDTATKTHAADFTRIGVDVAVPRNGTPEWTWYRVKNVMQWEGAHETDVVLTIMRWVVGGTYQSTHDFCVGVTEKPA